MPDPDQASDETYAELLLIKWPTVDDLSVRDMMKRIETMAAVLLPVICEAHNIECSRVNPRTGKKERIWPP